VGSLEFPLTVGCPLSLFQKDDSGVHGELMAYPLLLGCRDQQVSICIVFTVYPQDKMLMLLWNAIELFCSETIFGKLFLLTLDLNRKKALDRKISHVKVYCSRTHR